MVGSAWRKIVSSPHRAQLMSACDRLLQAAPAVGDQVVCGEEPILEPLGAPRSSVFAFTFICAAAAAQHNIDFHGVVREVGTEQPMRIGAVVKISDVNDTAFHQTARVNTNGRYSTSLPFDRVYRVDYEGPALITRHVIIDARGFPEKEKKAGYSVEIIMLLALRIEGLDYGLFDGPAGRLRYVPQTHRMEWDEEMMKRTKADMEPFTEAYRTARKALEV